MRHAFFFLTLLIFASCSEQTRTVEMVSTTEQNAWQSVENSSWVAESESPDVIINLNDYEQTIDGFGTCFNELGWTSLSLLSDADRESILKELFEPGVGANFTICRMPVAANDFARNWYSYDETDGDFEMENFSIANDFETLIPFIHNAQNYNPNIMLWASPWSPPQWMKYNGHYAARSAQGDSNFHSDDFGMDMRGINNGLTPDREGKEGTDMFIQEDKYLQAYALYFSKFIEAYRNEGIDISMVMPQNEFNSTQIFPSCTWTAASLANFIGKYLGPEMDKIGVDVMFGTVERANEALVDTILTDPDASKYVSGVGFQWAGKGAIPGINERYPELKMYQTEQECGNGKNDWENCVYSWDLVKQYMTNGTNAYLYWNTSLVEGGISTWGWKQNSLVTVDPETHTFQYNHEYYLMKHLSHYVQPGAKFVNSSGEFDNLLAFENPDGSMILIIQNEEDADKTVTVKLGEENLALNLKADSFTTVEIK